MPAGLPDQDHDATVALGPHPGQHRAHRVQGPKHLLVDVQLELGGLWLTLPIGVDLGGSWHPSAPHLVVANLLPLLPPDMTAVRFKFAPLLGGSWQIDDVYVDPRNRA